MNDNNSSSLQEIKLFHLHGLLFLRTTWLERLLFIVLFTIMTRDVATVSNLSLVDPQETRE